MNLKTLGATIAFFGLTVSMMMDNPSFEDRAPASTPVQTVNYDYALTAQKLVFTDHALSQTTDANGYLISQHQIQEMNQHSAEVVIDALQAIPADLESALKVTQNNAESNSINQ